MATPCRPTSRARRLQRRRPRARRRRKGPHEPRRDCGRCERADAVRARCRARRCGPRRKVRPQRLRHDRGLGDARRVDRRSFRYRRAGDRHRNIVARRHAMRPGRRVDGARAGARVLHSDRPREGRWRRPVRRTRARRRPIARCRRSRAVEAAAGIVQPSSRSRRTPNTIGSCSRNTASTCGRWPTRCSRAMCSTPAASATAWTNCRRNSWATSRSPSAKSPASARVSSASRA